MVGAAFGIIEQITSLPSPLLFLMGAVWLSQTVQAATGFGGMVIALALGANLYPLETLIPAVVLVNLFMSLYLVGRDGKAIDWRVLGKRILPFMGLGMPLGMLIFYIGPGDILEKAFGIFVIMVVLWELLIFFNSSRGGEEVSSPQPLKPWAAALWLLAGGVIHGIYASGGPLVVYFATRQLKDKGVFRSTLSMLWLIVTGILLAGYFYTGMVNLKTVSITAALLLPLFLGGLVGEYIHARINEKAFRLLVYLLLLVSGASLIN